MHLARLLGLFLILIVEHGQAAVITVGVDSSTLPWPSARDSVSILITSPVRAVFSALDGRAPQPNCQLSSDPRSACSGYSETFVELSGGANVTYAIAGVSGFSSIDARKGRTDNLLPFRHCNGSPFFDFLSQNTCTLQLVPGKYNLTASVGGFLSNSFGAEIRPESLAFAAHASLSITDGTFIVIPEPGTTLFVVSGLFAGATLRGKRRSH